MIAYDRNSTTRVRGASVFDLLVMVVAVAMISSIMINVAGTINDRSRKLKLESDVSTLNRAILLHLAAGGDLNGLETPEEVFRELRSKLSETDRQTFVGLGSGSTIDERLQCVWMDEKERSSSASRAYWDPSTSRFLITVSQRDGIKSFSLDREVSDEESPGGGRSSSVSYASQGNWIWDYVEATPNELAPVSDFTPVSASSSYPVAATPASMTGSGLPVSPSGSAGAAAPSSSGGVAVNLGSGNATSANGGIALNALSGGNTSSNGGIALGALSGGDTSSDGGIALGVLSGDTMAEEGQIAIGLLGLGITLGQSSSGGSPLNLGWSSGNDSSDPAMTTTGSPQVILGGEGAVANIGEGQAGALNGIAANVGEGSASAIQGVAANVGEGEASATNGAAANVGEGSATANQGVAGNLGGGSATANQGIGLNLGQGSANAGGWFW